MSADKAIKKPVRKKFHRLLGLLVLSIVVSCTSIQAENGAAENTITVYAASSLTDAFSEIATAFEAKNPDTAVLLNFAGSSQLAAQLREGMEGDLFASANPTQMETVIKAGRITPGTEQTFASNSLTVIVPADNPAAINSFEALAKPDVGLILASKGVPVRVYTDEIIATMPPDFQTNFYNNLVSEEDNVRRVAAKIALGEADAGIVYTTDVTADLAPKVQQIDIPVDQNLAAAYTLAPLSDAPHPELAVRFIEFVNSAKGRTILADFGFDPPPRY